MLIEAKIFDPWQEGSRTKEKTNRFSDEDEEEHWTTKLLWLHSNYFSFEGSNDTEGGRKYRNTEILECVSKNLWLDLSYKIDSEDFRKRKSMILCSKTD